METIASKENLYLLVRTQSDVPLCFSWMDANLISFPDLHFINSVYIFHAFFLSICDLGSYVFHHLLVVSFINTYQEPLIT